MIVAWDTLHEWRFAFHLCPAFLKRAIPNFDFVSEPGDAPAIKPLGFCLLRRQFLLLTIVELDGAFPYS